LSLAGGGPVSARIPSAAKPPGAGRKHHPEVAARERSTSRLVVRNRRPAVLLQSSQEDPMDDNPSVRGRRNQRLPSAAMVPNWCGMILARGEAASPARRSALSLSVLRHGVPLMYSNARRRLKSPTHSCLCNPRPMLCV
jgi:hypothetical protein